MNESNHISRSSILYGSTSEEVWFSLEQFYRDHIFEINHKLHQLDDEIWGKIILMERNKRIAKAYLRTTTVIIDGGCFGFDGRTIGFNSFDNPHRDTQVEDLRMKIGEGVILKMDCHGNIIAMARGCTPVFVQGAKSGHDGLCYSEKVAKLKGRLETVDATTRNEKKDRAAKIFDMKVFKGVIERELHRPYPNRKELLFKSCIRVSLVKDENHPLKTPCWFMLVNLVALDMLNAKVPPIPSLVRPPSPQPNPFMCRRQSDSSVGSNELSSRGQNISQSTTDLYGVLGVQATAGNLDPALSRMFSGAQVSLNPENLSAAWAAAQLQQQLQHQQSPVVPQTDQLAQLANSFALGVEPGATPTRNVLWKHTASGGYISESEATILNRRATQDVTQMKAAVQTAQQNCHWDLGQSMDSLYEPIDVDDDVIEDPGDNTSASDRLSGGNFSLHPPKPPLYDPPAAPPVVLQKKIFSPTTNLYGGFKPNTWSSNGSTSDYESTKDIYDSSTCSSSSRSSNSAAGRSSSPSIVSETASESQTSDSGYTESEPAPPPPRHPDPKKGKNSSSEVATLKPPSSMLNIQVGSNIKATAKPEASAKGPNPGQKSPSSATPGGQKEKEAFVSHSKLYLRAKRLLKPNHHPEPNVTLTTVTKDSSPLELSECDATLESSSEAETVKGDDPNRFKRSPPIPPYRRKLHKPPPNAPHTTKTPLFNANIVNSHAKPVKDAVCYF